MKSIFAPLIFFIAPVCLGVADLPGLFAQRVKSVVAVDYFLKTETDRSLKTVRVRQIQYGALRNVIGSI